MNTQRLGAILRPDHRSPGSPAWAGLAWVFAACVPLVPRLSLLAVARRLGR